MTTKINAACLILAAAGLFVAGPARAQTLVLFQTSDLDGTANTSDAPTTIAEGVSSSDLSLGAGLEGQTGWAGALDSAGFYGNATLADAIAKDLYYTVTITPDDGQTMDLANLHLILAINVGTDAGDNDLHLMSSVTGFTDRDTIEALQPTVPATGALTHHTFDIDLTGVAELQGVSGPVEFRLYTAKVGNRLAIGQAFDAGESDDLRLDGVVSAAESAEPAESDPEPPAGSPPEPQMHQRADARR